MNHWDESGRLKMVDISAKNRTLRRAIVSARLQVKPAHLAALSGNPKGDVFAAARLAGVGAAKKCPDLIPLCHNIELDFIDIRLEVDGQSILIEAETVANESTGVEMEAYCAASVAGVTLIDMLKGIDPDLTLGEIQLQSKSGGKSDFKRSH